MVQLRTGVESVSRILGVEGLKVTFRRRGVWGVVEQQCNSPAKLMGRARRWLDHSATWPLDPWEPWGPP